MKIPDPTQHRNHPLTPRITPDDTEKENPENHPIEEQINNEVSIQIAEISSPTNDECPTITIESTTDNVDSQQQQQQQQQQQTNMLEQRRGQLLSLMNDIVNSMYVCTDCNVLQGAVEGMEMIKNAMKESLPT